MTTEIGAIGHQPIFRVDDAGVIADLDAASASTGGSEPRTAGIGPASNTLCVKALPTTR